MHWTNPTYLFRGMPRDCQIERDSLHVGVLFQSPQPCLPWQMHHRLVGGCIWKKQQQLVSGQVRGRHAHKCRGNEGSLHGHHSVQEKIIGHAFLLMTDSALVTYLKKQDSILTLCQMTKYHGVEMSIKNIAGRKSIVVDQLNHHCMMPAE